jgi:hypothetical protein
MICVSYRVLLAQPFEIVKAYLSDLTRSMLGVSSAEICGCCDETSSFSSTSSVLMNSTWEVSFSSEKFNNLQMIHRLQWQK